MVYGGMGVGWWAASGEGGEGLERFFSPVEVSMG